MSSYWNAQINQYQFKINQVCHQDLNLFMADHSPCKLECLNQVTISRRQECLSIWVHLLEVTHLSSRCMVFLKQPMVCPNRDMECLNLAMDSHNMACHNLELISLLAVGCLLQVTVLHIQVPNLPISILQDDLIRFNPLRILT